MYSRHKITVGDLFVTKALEHEASTMRSVASVIQTNKVAHVAFSCKSTSRRATVLSA